MARHKILHRRTEAAAIWYELEVRPSFILKERTGNGRCSARASGPERRLVRVCLQPGNKLLQIGRLHGLLCDNQERITRDQRDRFEISNEVVLKRKHRAV